MLSASHNKAVSMTQLASALWDTEIIGLCCSVASAMLAQILSGEKGVPMPDNRPKL
jgi:hypothetical protein